MFSADFTASIARFLACKFRLRSLIVFVDFSIMTTNKIQRVDKNSSEIATGLRILGTRKGALPAVIDHEILLSRPCRCVFAVLGLKTCVCDCFALPAKGARAAVAVRRESCVCT